MSDPGAGLEMRRVFAEMLVELGGLDERIVVLDNDVGLTSLSERFKEAFPERYVDLGIAEKNLFGTAAGLAASGFVAIPTTFAAFAARCAMDQVSISIAYPGLDVKIPGHYIGGSRAGASHIAIEDLAVYRALPNFRVADPADNAELRAVMRVALAEPGPVYFRVSKLALPDLFGSDHTFTWGSGQILRPGRDVSLFATGMMTALSLAAARELGADGIDAEVVHLGSVKPIDAELIAASVTRTGCAVASELGSINGGFASAVADVVVERCPVPLRRIGYRDQFVHSASIDQILDQHGLRPTDIAAAARDAIDARVAASTGAVA
ncbi:MAG TPA: transketolase C-terminal domain-containing protein [Candidatus Saccharimonadales bacterium]|nr:transketolase C-terminal domain-containing protein [Candidatus Saccharimonadales bacterium]